MTGTCAPPVDDATIAGIIHDYKLDKTSPIALHDQAAAALRRAIADGEVKPGERLPPARDLAAVMGVNTNTLLRALRQLRDEGLLEFRRGRGITVSGEPDRAAVLEHAKTLVGLAHSHGYNTNELVAIIRSVSA
jgi:GntR family transcriptional regulator